MASKEIASSLWPELLLACPGCLCRLTLQVGAYLCPACGENYPIVRGIPRFVKDEAYVDSFGFEWIKHAQTQLDRDGARRSEQRFRNDFGITPEDICGKLVLDAGCGMGRYAEVASRYGARVIGIDMSQAVDSARQNLRDRENVQILQADLFHPPFPDGTFDFIYSIGVLHHTPNCEAAFRRLVRLLKPGGRIMIWVYSAYGGWFKMSDLYRKVTTRLPHRALHLLSYVAAPLGYLDHALVQMHLRPVAGLLRILLPVFFNGDPDWRWRVLNTFDWYSPRYQSKHTYEEVFQWFESEGLIHNRVVGSPIGVSGMRPSLKLNVAQSGDSDWLDMSVSRVA